MLPKNVILLGESVITLSTSIVSPDGSKIDQSVPWIIEIGNGKSTANHKTSHVLLKNLKCIAVLSPYFYRMY